MYGIVHTQIYISQALFQFSLLFFFFFFLINFRVDKHNKKKTMHMKADVFCYNKQTAKPSCRS